MPKPTKNRRKPPPSKSKPKPKPRPKKKAMPKSKAKSFNAVRFGQRVGNLFGSTGGRVGAEAGRLFRSITGFGDYKVNSNSLLRSDPLPSFSNMSSGTRVVHREYLFDVITSPTPGQFNIEQVAIQPALLASFPWLSASAENYQEYKINGLIFEFKSNSYNAVSSTNTAAGTVVMSTNYNVLDPPFTNKFQMEQSQFTCSDKPSNHLAHPIECARLETPTSVLFTRPGPVTTGDLRLYDWGNFFIATVGMQGSSTNLGELWISYDITLLKPKLGTTVDVYDHYVLPVGNFVPGGPAYFGTTVNPPQLTLDSDMGTFLTPSVLGSLDTINWPEGYTGNVMVIYEALVNSISGVGLAVPYVFTSTTGGVTAINVFSFGTPYALLTNQGLPPSPVMVYNGSGGTTYVFCLAIANGGSVTLGRGSTSGVPLAGDLIIVALPSNFATLGLPAPLMSLGAYQPLETKKREKTVSLSSESDPLYEVVRETPSPTPSNKSFSRPELKDNRRR